jgi:TonB family protein
MKKLLILCFFAIITLPAIAQNLTVTKYWDKYGDSTGKDNAFTYSIVSYTDTTKTVGSSRYYTMEGRLTAEISHKDSAGIWLFDGPYKAYHDNGKLKRKGYFISNKKNGEMSTWYDNGQMRRKDFYVLDSLITGHCYTATGQDTAWFPYYSDFSYGKGIRELYKLIGRNIKYPKTARKKEIEGEVRVQFIIQKDGAMTSLRLNRSVNEELDNEAIRVLRIIPARWHPTMIDGEPESGYAILPVVFKLVE